MRLNEILLDTKPGTVIHHGKKDDSNFVEIFILQDGSLRFSDELMMIDDKIISSDKWEK